MRIESYSFGHMVIDGKTYTRDLKVINGLVYPNWWRKEGHLLQLEDIKDIIDARPSILVLGLGASGVMRLHSGVEEVLGEQGIHCIARPTGEAVSLFNELIVHKGEGDVAGAFHLTC